MVPAGGGRLVRMEAGEGAVDVAAGADALDDLLAEVAAFGEVQGAGLVGLLREVFVADVGAVEGCAGEDAELFEGFGVGFDGVVRDDDGDMIRDVPVARTRIRSSGTAGCVRPDRSAVGNGRRKNKVPFASG